MKRLCGSNALPYVTDILAGTTHGVPGVWLPTSILDSKTKTIEDRLKEAILQKAPNRAARRMASSSRVQGRALRSAFAGNAHERRVQDAQGLTDEFVANAPTSRYVKGEITERQFNESLAKMFCDPTYFFEKWFVEQRRDNPFRLQVIQIGLEWIERMRNMADTLTEYRRVRSGAVKARREFYSRLRDSELPSSLKRVMSEKMSPLPPPLSLADPQFSLGDAPSRMRYVECYLKHHVAAQAAKSNDFGDLLHLFYSPDVDVMRCDRAIYEAVRRCPYLETDKLTPALEMVVPRIVEISAGRQAR
jgi:hypothetical protein